jgi:hypothetical protein
VLLIVPTSLDVIIVPDVVGNVITLPLVVLILDTFTVVAEIDPVTLTLDADIDPLLTIELPVIVPSTTTFDADIGPLVTIELLVIVPLTDMLANIGTPLA